jgi:ABC-type uncharacterized transport system involved in gliding motility auxiliary subunit
MKTIKISWKYLNYLFWLGPILLLMGLSAGIVSGTWVGIPLGLAIAGLVMIGLWLLLLGRLEPTSPLQPGFWRRRSTQVSTNAFVATLAVLVILGLINFLGVRYVTRLDLTENQAFTLALQTQDLIRTLKQPVKVWVFDPRQNPQDQQLLESYHRLSQQFSYEFINPDAQPSLVQTFGVKKLGDVFIELPGARRQFVQTVDAMEAQETPLSQGRLSESKLTNAIEQLIRDRAVTVYFLQGHGEHPLDEGQGAMTQAVKALSGKSYTSKPLSLIQTGEFPKDADVVVLAGPQKALLAPEVRALITYLNQGGNVLLLADPTDADLGLDPFLSPWGVTLDKRVAIDASGRIVNLGPADAVVNQYGDHPITKEFGSNVSFYSFSRPLDIKPIAGVKSTPLLQTSERSWAESNIKEQPLKFDPGSDRQGPLTLGVALTRASGSIPVPHASPASPSSPPLPTSPSPSPSPSPTPPNKSGKKEARLVVLGNSSFAIDGFFDKALNGDVFLNSVRWLSQQDQQPLSIRPKEAKNRRIVLTPQQANLVSWIAIGILPILGFGTAIAVWWKQR